MHVGLLIYGELETISGGYLYDRRLVEHLRRCDDQVEILSLPGRRYPLCLADNLSGQLYQRLAGFRGDLLLQDELCHPSLFWLNRRLKQEIASPLLSIVHHLRSRERRPAWQNRLYRLVETAYLKTLDGFVFNSQTTRDAVRQAGVDLGRLPSLVAFPAGDQFAPSITDEEIRRRAFQPGPLRVIFLGNLIPRKNLPTLLRAVAALPPGACTLTIVGSLHADPACARRLRRQIAAAGLQERVRLLGALPREKLAAELRSHHVLAVPSFYEGYGIVYLEGMSFGLPAIAAAAGAASEIVASGRDGYLVSPHNAADLANRLGELSGDRRRLAEMSQAARRRFEVQPTWEQTCSAIRRFLLAELAKRK